MAVREREGREVKKVVFAALVAVSVGGCIEIANVESFVSVPSGVFRPVSINENKEISK